MNPASDNPATGPSRGRGSVLPGLVDIAGVAGVVAAFLAAMWHWNRLPGRIPTRFSLAGTPDAWGGRWMIWVLPFVALALFVGLSGLAARVGGAGILGSGAREDTARRLGEEFVGVVRTLAVWLMALLTWQTVEVSLGRRQGLDLKEGLPLLAIGAALGVLIAMGGALRRFRSG